MLSRIPHRVRTPPTTTYGTAPEVEGCWVHVVEEMQINANKNCSETPRNASIAQMQKERKVIITIMTRKIKAKEQIGDLKFQKDKHATPRSPFMSA